MSEISDDMEEAHRESEARPSLASPIQAVLEQVSEAIFMLDPETMRFISANPALHELLGYTPEELVNMTIYDVLPYDRERIARTTQRVFDEGKYHVSDRLYKRKDGSLVNVEVGITPVLYGGRRVFCQVLRDITERKRAEEERNQLLANEQTARTAAETAVRVRDELLAVVSHDLKNPLAAIRGSAQLLRKRVEQMNTRGAEQLTGLLTRIDQAQRKMNMLINELMDFGQLQAGLPITLQRRPTDLVALTREVISDQQEQTEKHMISFEATIPSVIGRWDAERLERVLINLVSNAIKYSPGGGEVRVAVSSTTDDGRRTTDDSRRTLDYEGRETNEEQPPSSVVRRPSSRTWAIVEVRDKGLGISPEDLPHIFEWFRRADSVSGHFSGSGIGLASSLHAVRQHGGTIEVESEVGAGSIFTMRLPVL